AGERQREPADPFDLFEAIAAALQEERLAAVGCDRSKTRRRGETSATELGAGVVDENLVSPVVTNVLFGAVGQRTSDSPTPELGQHLNENPGRLGLALGCLNESARDDRALDPGDVKPERGLRVAPVGEVLG